MSSLKSLENGEPLDPGEWEERSALARRQIDSDRRDWKVRRVNLAEDNPGEKRRCDDERRLTLFRRKKTDRRKSPFL